MLCGDNMKKIVSVMFCVAIVLCFSACSSQKQGEIQIPTQHTTATEIASSEAKNGSRISADNGFTPFTCSEDDDFSIFCKIGGVSYKVDTEANSLIQSQNSFEKTVLTFDDDVKSCMLVGNAIYISCANGLYRLPVDDSGNCSVDKISVVVSGILCTPSYCLNNQMSVRVSGTQDDSYLLLDTQTGDYEAAYNFNEYLSDGDAPSGLISSEKAGETALEKIKSKEFEGYFSEENYSAVSSVTLVHYPDFYYGIQGTVWEFGKHSEYSYMVEIVADGKDIAPKFTVFVNAYNSEIQFVSFRKS